MSRRFVRGLVWVLLALVFGGWSLGTEARAQFKSAEASPQPDSVQSLAPTPLSETRSLDAYVRDPRFRRSAPLQLPAPDRYDSSLGQGQKLLLGTLGMVLHSVCDSDWKENDPMKPYPLLDAGERRCVECNQVGERAFDAVLEGVFSSDS